MANHGHIHRVRAGDLITEGLFNRIIDKIEPFSKITAGTDGYMTYWTGPSGTNLNLLLPTDQMARLIGSTSPYSWQSVYRDGSGGWVDGPNLSYNGTNDAYEYNGASGLDGKVVRMHWTSAGDWRFQALRYGPTECESGRICVTVDVSGGSCAGFVASGVTVTVTDSQGNNLGTGKTTGQLTGATLSSGGSGYTNGTGYTLGISGDGSGAAGTFDVVGGVVTNVQITSGGSNYSSATLSFPGAGGSGAAGTATIKGRLCFAMLTPGLHTITTTVPGSNPVVTTLTATCGIDNFATVTYGTSGRPVLAKICLKLNNCRIGGPIPAEGGTVTATSGPGIPVPGSATGTQGADGSVCLTVVAGNWSASGTFAGSTINSSVGSLAACATFNQTLTWVSQLHYRVWAANTASNRGCSATYEIQKGFSSGGPVLASGTITLPSTPDIFGYLMSDTLVLDFVPQPGGQFWHLVRTWPEYSFDTPETFSCPLPDPAMDDFRFIDDLCG